MVKFARKGEWNLIDLHCHILPGLDDGPRTMADSLRMAESAVRSGIGTVFATPHHLLSPYDNGRDAVLRATSAFEEALGAAGIPLKVRPGQEIRLAPEWLSDAYEGRLLPLGGTSYALIELPSSGIPADLEHSLHEMSVLGWTPIIAHPERNREAARNPERLRPFVEAGALCQLTSHSVTGLFGGETRRAALEMCERGLVHLVASDAHDCVRRPFRLREALTELAERFGEAFAARLERNAELVAEGRRAEAAPRGRAASTAIGRWARGKSHF